MPEQHPLLEIRNLHTWFLGARGAVHAVDDVSLSVERGETLGIVGESGCGKTALARTLMRLHPAKRVEHAGQVLFEGRDLLSMSNAELRKVRGADVAMVFQDPMTSLHPLRRIGTQITEVLRLHTSLAKHERRDRALELLRSMHIPDPERRLSQYPYELSGGLRQRVMIAIAVAAEPKLLIADEPTTALDVTVQAEILDLLDEQRRRTEMALILVTHDFGVVETRTDRVAVMYGGQVVELGSTRELLETPRMPYTGALLASIPGRRGASERLNVIPGRPPDLSGSFDGCRFGPRCTREQDRCRSERPQLELDTDSGHRFRCFFPLGTDVPDCGGLRSAQEEGVADGG